MTAIGPIDNGVAANQLILPSGASAATIVTGYNALLASLKASGVMLPDTPAGLHRAAILALNPISYLRANDPSGATVAATVAANGAYVASPTLGVAGAFAGETAVLLNGAAYQYLTVTPGTPTVDTFTVYCWVKRTSIGTMQGIFRGGSGSQSGPQLLFHSINVILCGRDGSTVFYTHETLTDTTKFHQVVWTKSGATGIIYLDGVACTPDGGSNLTMSSVTDFSWGVDSNLEYLSGAMNELVIFNTALTAPQIAALYAIHP